MKRPITGLTQSAERLLFNAPWPGNIRELRNVLERACILSEAGMITERDLASALTTKSAALGGDADAPSGRSAVNAAAAAGRARARGNRWHTSRRRRDGSGSAAAALYRRIDGDESRGGGVEAVEADGAVRDPEQEDGGLAMMLLPEMRARPGSMTSPRQP